MTVELRLRHASLPALKRDHDADLRKGRAFVAGATGLAERDPCRLVVVHPETGGTLALEAEVVWVKSDAPGAGVGVELRGFGEAEREALRAFVESAAPTPAPAPPPAPAREPPPRNVHERVRALSIPEREIMARQGTLPERTALERCYGASVWEGLLQNPQITPPEVARIAKNGTLPRPLVQHIVGNPGWLSIAEVQRALLGNPRCGGAHLERVLRAMARADLERVAAMSVYRAEVRQAAKKLLGSR
ncbi:MAG: hypothetical protein IT372_21720 [Polyangiaceae bacterium]|nr:hypothetical protein [Polyangiaceae bacterium]